MKQETLHKIQMVSSILSAIAIPVVLALVGWWVQSSMKSEDIKKDYIQMAIGILQDGSKNKDDDLRKWAVAILVKNSPVSFSGELRGKLEKGDAQLAFFFPAPPASLMESPKQLIPLEQKDNLTNGDLLTNVIKNYEICNENSIKLKYLQSWARTMKDISSGSSTASKQP